ncbi:hypothetical protein FRC0535_00018 [Corynebacterium diphtheriae]|nr:hypothetical protein FRC0535_00018 [Corynebacterium diphtheriae]
MKLQTAAIRRYRSIDEMDGFTVEPDVTCLVGKNESGKTAVLQALNKSFAQDKTKFDGVLDYPTTRTSERRREKGKSTVTQLVYALEQSDIDAVEEELGSGAISDHSIFVTTAYDGSTKWSVFLNEDAIVRNLTSSLQLPEAPQRMAEEAESVENLLQVLRGLDEPNSTATQVIQQVESWRHASAVYYAIDKLSGLRPKFVYFGEYDSMPGEVLVKELIHNRDTETLTRGQQAFLSLLHLAGVEPEDFINPESDEHLIRDVENASNGITAEVFKYWSQNTNLRVELRVGQVNSGTYAGPKLQIRVLNQKHNVTVPFDERSRGFVWFFSFLAYFSAIEEESSNPLILLLDEPGLNLHARAQADLLRFIDDRLAPSHQVILTTHSPFMINPQQLHRVRVVEDHEQGGTVVSADVLKANRDTVFPLMAAMGVDLTQTLWVGPNVLLVEGPSDVVYLNYLSEALRSQGRENLDPRWTITPGGGLAKLPTFLALFGANQMNVAVLTDSSVKEEKTLRRLKEAGRLGSSTVIEIGTILNRTEADLEDLFTPAQYLKMVNAAYQGALQRNSITVGDLPPGDRLVARVESYFTKEAVNGGKFSHFAPAGALMRGEIRQSKLAEITLGAAEELMKQLNSLLPTS